ncbi:hypothetical protein DICSQDRAFT_99172 [Dichomitus squalens LYAD-421 SS1]|uniref:uncharacterized protein n=1 Tax=Dichomitus squalens (strain LYAD-421) TaxID=732165 RepID=UPI00044143E6|nr:uncharacterized protein DICSQDRAFT_99172 [Dichomitus squalens LYAD-421 SS1]EJF65383.1 hypothetical protein DICSQDRAFT_99172 [Dichomitus squalens LYAD-421 SS1]
MDTPLTLDRLPAEILLEVASYLSSGSDVLQLSLVSSATYAKVVPALYADVELRGAEQCERTLAMLVRCPAVARHIRRLAVFPEDDPARLRGRMRAWDSAGVVSRAVMKVARHLDALARFEWDGEDMLPDDRMWSELRGRCPRLRHVGTTFGCFLPRPTSSLLQFSDLSGFSLTLKDGFYAHSLHLPSRESEPVFRRLWDMLTLRCPDLESLRIIGNTSEPSDAARLYTATWPKLRHLAFGAAVCNTTTPGHANRDFVDFLERHPALESLHLLGRPSSNQVDLSALSPDALPNLKEFSGTFNLLRMLVDRSHQSDPAAPPNFAQAPAAIPNPNQDQSAVAHNPLSKTLQRLCFPHAMHLRDLTPLVISRVLQGLHALTSMKVTFAIQGGYDSNGIFRTIVASCPHLLDLDITCTNRPSFFLDAFANSLRGLPRLRTLSLSLVRMAGEEPMHVGASRIALANPRLKSFSIAFIPAHGAPSNNINNAPAALSSVYADQPPAPLEQGTFELTSDVHGIPVCLAVHQRCAALWPWQRHAGAGTNFGAGVGAGVAEPRMCVRRWVCDLRPSGHPDVAQKGVGELLVERSPAGEEARLMVFCLCLLLLTVWALTNKAAR